MKALSKKLIPFILIAVAVTSLFSVQSAQAYSVTLDQVGANVVATGSGVIDLTGLTLSSSGFSATPGVNAAIGNILLGPGGFPIDAYKGFTGPTNFGSGGSFDASFDTGNGVGINASTGLLSVPHGYPGNADLGTSSITFFNKTFASLGVTPGTTFEWMWGTGANQNFTLVTGPAPVPDSGSTVSLLGCALLGLAALRRKLS